MILQAMSISQMIVLYIIENSNEMLNIPCGQEHENITMEWPEYKL